MTRCQDGHPWTLHDAVSDATFVHKMSVQLSQSRHAWSWLSRFQRIRSPHVCTHGAGGAALCAIFTTANTLLPAGLTAGIWYSVRWPLTTTLLLAPLRMIYTLRLSRQSINTTMAVEHRLVTMRPFMLVRLSQVQGPFFCVSPSV